MEHAANHDEKSAVNTRTLSLVLGFMVLSGAGGMHLGGYFERQSSGAERGAVTEIQPPRLGSVALPTLRLRCENGDPPRAWTQVEAEARMHTAQMSLRSAEHHGAWTDLGYRWAKLADAQMAEVRLCWGGEKP